MRKRFKGVLRALILVCGTLPLLTSCGAIRNLLTPERVEVQLTDTVYLETVKVDTVQVTLPVDTVVIETERVRARVIRSFDTIQLDAECKTDTVIVTRSVSVPTKVKVVKEVPRWLAPAAAVATLAALFLAVLVLVKS